MTSNIKPLWIGIAVAAACAVAIAIMHKMSRSDRELFSAAMRPRDIRLQEEMEIVQREIERIRSDVRTCIEAIPDNPDIRRHGRGYDIDTADMDANLDAFYYDWGMQKSLLLKWLDGNLEETFLPRLRRVLRDGKVKVKGTTYHFNPKFVKHLRNSLSAG